MGDKYDIRDDEEQEKKGKEVMELLVAAGYFRARIKVRNSQTFILTRRRLKKVFCQFLKRLGMFWHFEITP